MTTIWVLFALDLLGVGFGLHPYRPAPGLDATADLNLPGITSIDLGGVTCVAGAVTNLGGLESDITLVNGTLNTRSIESGGPITVNSNLTNTLGNPLTLRGGGSGLTIGGAIMGSGVAVSVLGPVGFNGINIYTGSTLVQGSLTLNGRIANSSLVHVEDGQIIVGNTNGLAARSQTLCPVRGNANVQTGGAVHDLQDDLTGGAPPSPSPRPEPSPRLPYPRPWFNAVREPQHRAAQVHHAADVVRRRATATRLGIAPWATANDTVRSRR